MMADDKQKIIDPENVPDTHTWVPPSQQPPPQYPAVKPGETVPVDSVDPLRMKTPKAKEEPKPEPQKPGPQPAPQPSPPPGVRRP
jgi:hypothetical protein